MSCQGTTKKGERCKNPPKKGFNCCHLHLEDCPGTYGGGRRSSPVRRSSPIRRSSPVRRSAPPYNIFIQDALRDIKRESPNMSQEEAFRKAVLMWKESNQGRSGTSGSRSIDISTLPPGGPYPYDTDGNPVNKYSDDAVIVGTNGSITTLGERRQYHS